MINFHTEPLTVHVDIIIQRTVCGLNLIDPCHQHDIEMWSSLYRYYYDFLIYMGKSILFEIAIKYV